MATWILLLLWTAQAAGPPVARPAALAEAKAQFFSRQFQQAAVTLRELIVSDPADVSARYWLVRTLIEDNQPREALKEAEAAEREYAGEPLPHVACGDVHLRLADFDRALADYEAAIRLNPNEPRAQLGLGRVLSSDFRFNSANEHLRTAFRLDPQDPDIALALSSIMPRSAEQLKLEEQFADQATYRDPEELEGTKALVSLLKLKGARRPFVAENPPDAIAINLQGMPPSSLRPSAFVIPVAAHRGGEHKLLVDSGAHGILVCGPAASSIERLVPYRLGGLGDAGRLGASLGWADSVTVGIEGLVLRDCPVVVTDKALSRLWEGIIGADVFRDFLITFDFPNSLLRLEKRPGSPAYDYSWDRPAEPDAGLTPVRLVEGKLLVATEANGKAAGYFVLDTGAGQTLISRSAGEAVSKLTSSNRRIGGLSGRVQEVLRSEELLLRFAGIEHRASLTAVDLSRLSYTLGVEISGLIGCDILRDISLFIDYRYGFVKLVRAPESGK